MENHKISVVTVTYNCQDIVEETILSIINQDYDNLEYIVIDGKSNDNTLSIIDKYLDKIDVVVSEPDKGIFDAMNKSLNYVTGDYVLFMNAGDKFVDNNTISKIFSDHLYTEDLIFGDSLIQTEFGYKLRKANPIYARDASPKEYVFEGQGICHQSLFTKTEILKTVKFCLDYPIGADYDTTHKVYENGNKLIKYFNFPIAIFDDRNGGASHYKEAQMYKERYLMFNYKASFKDKMYVFIQMCNSSIKHWLEVLFPMFVKIIRAKKYKQNLESF